MCGVVGFLGGPIEHETAAYARVRAMSEALIHRGPDDGGVWCDANTRIGLGHRRLSILDLSAAGHQPMISGSGRYVIVFNGEIYNHLELRAGLDESAPWRGHSDTETLLASIEVRGLHRTLTLAVGMFAIALWDRQTRVLTLARDRLGEKPMYYGWQGTGADRTFLFGSELKALRKHAAFDAQIDRGALGQLLRHNYIPAPSSIYQGISKLAPGGLLSVSMAQPDAAVQRYWDAVAIAGNRAPFAGRDKDAVDTLESMAKQAVRAQMISDVPLGGFLSGGIDSSTVVALMQAQSTIPVKTFTIGFHEAGYDEAQHAKAVARHLGTDHTELYVTHRDALNVIPKLPGLYCEPFADSTQIPNYLVSELARRKVTVALSGDAGDELFCGYRRYALTIGIADKLCRLPGPLRSIAARLARLSSDRKWQRRAALLASHDLDDLYCAVMSHVPYPSEWLNEGVESFSQPLPSGEALGALKPEERMMLTDTLQYLPDDILVKVDRAAMGVSLETRVPLLDHRVVEFAWSLPLAFKRRDGVSKWVLRQVLYRYVPRQLIERPKQGFTVPIAEWLRGELREWAESLLDESSLRRDGYLSPLPVRKAWRQHLSGNCDMSGVLWNVLMFQAWRRAQSVP